VEPVRLNITSIIENRERRRRMPNRHREEKTTSKAAEGEEEDATPVLCLKYSDATLAKKKFEDR
jgi:hypothetical protein